jgi:hypothetical protein
MDEVVAEIVSDTQPHSLTFGSFVRLDAVSGTRAFACGSRPRARIPASQPLQPLAHTSVGGRGFAAKSFNGWAIWDAVTRLLIWDRAAGLQSQQGHDDRGGAQRQDQTAVSWNPMRSWLRQIEGLQRACKRSR